MMYAWWVRSDCRIAPSTACSASIECGGAAPGGGAPEPESKGGWELIGWGRGNRAPRPDAEPEPGNHARFFALLRRVGTKESDDPGALELGGPLRRRSARPERPRAGCGARGERRRGPSGARRLAGAGAAARDPRAHARRAADPRDRHARRLQHDLARARARRGRTACA